MRRLITSGVRMVLVFIASAIGLDAVEITPEQLDPIVTGLLVAGSLFWSWLEDQRQRERHAAG